MLKIEQLKLSPGGDVSALRDRAARLLRMPPERISSLTVLRRSVDAREEPVFSYTVAVEVRGAVPRIHDRRVSRWEPPVPYRFPEPVSVGPGSPRPVVAGAGPAGLFAALVLAHAGARPILLERGRDVERRRADVERFWSDGVLNLESNVQFGEGGAGTFSDGKLNTGTRDPRHRFILEQFVACGAPADILIDAKPHVGTDRLRTVLKNLRAQLLSLGAEVRFESRLADIITERGALSAVEVDGPGGTVRLPCRQLILALGHSARDTFAMLVRRGVPMEAKPFAVGVRIEHRQADMDAALYRTFAGHPGLPAASYKLSCHLPGGGSVSAGRGGNGPAGQGVEPVPTPAGTAGRGVFSFCVCPGGEVVAAASEAGRVVTNGMSEYARDRENINGALLVGVTPEDFATTWDSPGGPDGGQIPETGDGAAGGPLAGVAFQRRLEAAAYALGGGGYRAPVQRVGDFLAGRPSAGPGRVRPTYRPGVVWTDLRLCLPPFVADSIALALPLLGKKLRGYDDPDAVLTAVESRSSSPVRLTRGGTYQSARVLPDGGYEPGVRGLYPCGEGAGYAGGILSAAADGMRCAEQVCAALGDGKIAVPDET